MAVKFNEKERAQIIAALRQSAARRAAADSMRKTTVDELAADAGISKGAFYKFYPSKEHLFLDMLEQWQAQVAASAAEAFDSARSLPSRQRAAAMMKAAIRAMRAQSMAGFLQTDVPLLLRKLPEELSREHYQSIEEFILGMIRKSGVALVVPEAVVSAAIRVLFLSQLTADRVSVGYEAAIDALIDGATMVMVK